MGNLGIRSSRPHVVIVAAVSLTPPIIDVPFGAQGPAMRLARM